MFKYTPDEKQVIGVLPATILVIFIAVFLFSAYQLTNIFLDYKAQDEYNEKIQKEFVSMPTTAPDSSNSQEPEKEEIIVLPEVNFDSLIAYNKDVIAWLYLPNSVINYPVVYSYNNNNYLKTGLDGKHLESGTLFSDMKCGAVGEDKNLIIYGHNMKSGKMFATLCEYKQQSYYEKHKKLFLLTPSKTYELLPFAGKIIEKTSEDYKISFGTDDEFVKYAESLKNKSTFKSDVTIAKEDKMVTLSTCSYEFKDARYVLFCKMVEKN